MRRVVGPLFVLAMIASCAPAEAHLAEEPTEVEIEVLADEGDDLFYFYDGYDLYTLFVREAYVAELDEEGLVFRFTIYGGFGPEHLAEELHIDIGPQQGPVLRLSTPDDQAWSGELRILALNITADAPPFNGFTTTMQAFAPYEALGVAPGATLGPLTMWSYADADLRDIAPGGTYVPGSMGMGEISESPWGPSTRLVDAIELAGPVGYVERELSAQAGSVVARVVNPFAEAGQHVHLAPQATAGWTVTPAGPEAVSLDGGEEGTLHLNVTASPDASEPLAVAILTDTGGREWFYVGVDGEQLVVSDASDVPVRPAVPAESPLAPWMALVALAAVAMVRPRRPRRAAGAFRNAF